MNLHQKSSRNSDWKAKYESALREVKNGQAIDSTKIKEYVDKIGDKEALLSAKACNGKVYQANAAFLRVQPVHLVRSDGIQESDPTSNELRILKKKAILDGLNKLFLPVMILFLGVLAILYTFIMQSPSILVYSFAGILFVCGIVLFIKSMRTTIGLLNGSYVMKCDTLRNVLTFQTEMSISSTKRKTTTYYFADTDCFRCITLTAGQWKKLKSKEGKRVGLISWRDELKLYLLN